MIDKGCGVIREEINEALGSTPSWENFLTWFSYKSSSGVSASDMIVKFTSIVIPIAVFMITISGISFIIPNISDEKRRTAKTILVSSILGLIFLLVFRLVIEYAGKSYGGAVGTPSPVPYYYEF